jgi:hypothetical protein
MDLEHNGYWWTVGNISISRNMGIDVSHGQMGDKSRDNKPKR